MRTRQSCPMAAASCRKITIFGKFLTTCEKWDPPLRTTRSLFRLLQTAANVCLSFPMGEEDGVIDQHARPADHKWQPFYLGSQIKWLPFVVCWSGMLIDDTIFLTHWEGEANVRSGLQQPKERSRRPQRGVPFFASCQKFAENRDFSATCGRHRA